MTQSPLMQHVTYLKMLVNRLSFHQTILTNQGNPSSKLRFGRRDRLSLCNFGVRAGYQDVPLPEMSQIHGRGDRILDGFRIPFLNGINPLFTTSVLGRPPPGELLSRNRERVLSGISQGPFAPPAAGPNRVCLREYAPLKHLPTMHIRHPLSSLEPYIHHPTIQYTVHTNS